MKRIFTSTVYLFFACTLFGQWIQTDGPEGVKAYEIKEVESQIWAATEAGLYISDDEGLNWTIADFLPNESTVRNIFVQDDEVALTVAVFDYASSNYNYFFYRSTDLGTTWISTDLPSGSFSSTETLISKVDDTFIYSRSSSLHRSDDNGASWQEVIRPVYTSQTACNGDQILISSYHVSYLSHDKGDTWEFVDSIGTQTELFLEGSRIFISTVYDSIHISEDLGQSWTVIPTPGEYTGGYIRRGASGMLYFFGSAVYTSADNGYTWDFFSAGNLDYYVPPREVIELSNEELLFATNRGIFRTADNGSHWLYSHSGITGTAIYELKVLPNGEILARTNIGFFRSPNGGDNWFPVNFDFYFPALRFIGEKGDSLLFTGSGNNLFLSTDNLNTADSIASPPSGGDFRIVNDRYYILGYNSFYSDDLENWTEFTIVDANNTTLSDIEDLLHVEDNVLLAVTTSGGTGNVYRSEDNGLSWTLVLDFWGTGPTHKFLYEINDRIFFIDDDGWFYSVDNGLTWTPSEMGGIPLDQSNDLPVNIAAIGNIMFTAVPPHGVYISTDSGQSWEPSNGGLGSLRSRTLLYDNERLYLGTRTSGIWRRGATFESVEGLVYNDLNNNGTQETNEPPLEDILIHSSPLNAYTSTNNVGLYTLYSDVLNDTIRAIPPTPYSIIQPDYYLVTQPSTNLDFGIHLIPDMDDLSVTLTNLEPFRPGFDNSLILTVENVGTTTLSPIVKLPISNELTFLNASLTPTQIDVDTLIWELPPLPAFESVNITIEVNLDNTVDIGTWLTLYTYVLPINGDQNINNNIYTLRTEVVGSYDPNDKQVEPEAYFTPEQYANEESLIYTIRFQNTGNYFAQNVRIIDTLSEKLDLASFNLLSTSHPRVEWNVRGENVLEFVFEDILLPDSVNNEPESHGFIKFSIQLKDGLSIGEEIFNFADIYFDFNEPVRTNTATILLDEKTSIAALSAPKNNLQVSPNPANNHCYISLNNGRNGIGDLSIYDVKGNRVLAENIEIADSPSLIDLNKLASGFYCVKLMLGEEVFYGKVIIQ